MKATVTILQHSVHDVTLTSVIAAALHARRHQYAVRDQWIALEGSLDRLETRWADLEAKNERLRAKLHEREAQVRQLSLALSTAEQQERDRIAQVLHDHLQQLIHGAKIWAESLVERGPDASEKAPRRIVELLDDAIKTTRSLTTTLSPPSLQTNGLEAALEWLALHVTEMHGLDVLLHLDAVPSIDNMDARILLFSLTRELLFNVVKHAETDEAVLHTSITDDAFMIAVEDEGVGFDAEVLDADADPDNNHDGFGLFSVRKRAQLIGGRMEISSTPGRGTTVRLVVPLDVLEETNEK
jgi:signal transduction histidine kinase